MLKKLFTIQEEFTKTLLTPVSLEDYLFALNIEIAEFLNTLPWKWWKKNQPVDKERVLDEVADILAFFLSYYNQYFKTHVSTERFLTKEERDHVIAGITFKIEMGMQKALEKDHAIYDVTYFDKFKMTNGEVVGFCVGRIIKLAMLKTKSSYEEIIDAYVKKMEVNHSRQKSNY